MIPVDPIESIEILSVDLLDQNRPLVEDLKRLAKKLRLEFGWHYLLDLAWVVSRLGDVHGKRILDAGAGTGILQWYLAEKGAEVISVDRMSRAALPLRFRRRYRTAGVRTEDLLSAGSAFMGGFSREVQGPLPRRVAARLAGQTRDLLGYLGGTAAVGQVRIYNQDLAALPDIPVGWVDAVASISALEHNTPEGLAQVVPELMRVIKPGGVLLATLTAGKDQDWWHAASSGWCYTDATLRRLFELPDHAPSNWDRFDLLLARLRDCRELRENLASFYFSGDGKGMPGGVWDPQYQPVGVCKVKN